MEMMVILDMVRWYFVLPDLQAAQMYTRRKHRNVWLIFICLTAFSVQTKGLTDATKAGGVSINATRHDFCFQFNEDRQFRREIEVWTHKIPTETPKCCTKSTQKS